MADALTEQMGFGPTKETLSAEMLQVLTTGNAARLEELLISAGQTNGGHVAINLHATAPPDPGPGTHSSLLLGVTSNGNTALHLVASRGHVKLAALICERAPSLVGTRNRGLDTPLHCAARAGHREVAARLLSTMQSRGVEEAATLRATNRMGATALHEAVRHSREEVVDLFMAEAPDLASVTSDDGLSPLYLAATTRSVQMIRLLLRPSPDGTPSPASSAGPKGRTALHAAAIFCKGNNGTPSSVSLPLISVLCAEMVQDMLAWKPEGPALLTRVDSEGKSALHFAVLAQKLDVVELFLNVDSQLASISDNEGSSPVHYAACWGNTKMIDVLTRKCPVYYELVDHDGRNLLHCAVMKNNDTVVRYICQNERFAMLLNMTDFDGDTPLHLAVMCGYPRIVSILLQSTRLDVNINNKDGLTALDLASYAFPSGRLPYILDPSVMVFHFLCWAGGNVSLDSMDSHNKDESAREDFTEKDYAKGTIASALIASVTFAAAFTIPGGIIADDHPLPGTAILARRFIFRAFVVSDIVAFLCSIVATGFLIYGGVIEIPRSLRQQYTMMSSLLVPTAAQFMIAAFAFGLHLVLGVANGGLIIFVYVVSSASVLFVVANTWIPLHVYGFAKAIWRRDGWKGLLKIHQRPFFFEATHQRSLGKLKLLGRLIYNPPAMLLGGSLALPMCATFFVAIALEICFPKLLS
ncbi:hypothetical protein EJB05_12177, partial [Eragrostis curvula]